MSETMFAICDTCAAQAMCFDLGDDEHICESCHYAPVREAQWRRMQAVIKAATAIAAEVDRFEAERERPVKETYKHPSTGETEDNAMTVNMRLLNQLRKAVKELQ